MILSRLKQNAPVSHGVPITEQRDYQRLNLLQQRYSLELIRWRNAMSPTETDAQPKDPVAAYPREETAEKEPILRWIEAI